ncbi:hypothetical protein JMA_02650 [Jeotgalibacillus malaysiensis]|uniref:Uncharacterized protein n=1 Tax=Jeotgalibacillus malaysiensis TaxID=1508404 RepID=A0A0B5ALJ7_9BACL|nr:hypothetical protein [Jeotgalibacillus malaysiensis]AJD89582.1 hypothetical protein JMA_02650 [Jeotgalibacillus malaysiensis]
MTREKLNGLIIFSIAITVIGLILLFFSVSFGTSLGENWLFQRGGADTAMYHLVIESYIQNFLVAGGVLFGIGLVTTIFSYYKLLSTTESLIK